jgi:beta-1,4-mannooligosaccharide/beta-1,4-mannosyl-N-acetylglucosamine phosphorylase
MDRYMNNPVVERSDIPEIAPDLIGVTSVFNPGAVLFNGKIKLMLRVQNRARETYFIMAESDDGINFQVEDKIVTWKDIEKVNERIFHVYDPRITKIRNLYYIMFAMDIESGCKLGLGSTADFIDFQFIDIVSQEDNRNGVLFPEKVSGKYLRLDRPNKVQLEDGPLTGSSIWLSESDDLLNWKPVKEIIKGEPHYWDELIGAGPPPIKTPKGWLQIYHGIAMHYQPIYQAGVMLLDLEDPSQLISRGRFNILEPRELYETTGQVPNVCFPTGIIIEEFDENGFARLESKVSVYYGAADTSVGLATSTVEKLLNKCFE